MKFIVHSLGFRVIAVIFGLSFMVLELTGCEAFVRKFSRKSKKEEPKEEMVLAPEEYKGPNLTKEQLYRQYFLYWQSWHDELINALNERKSNKKQLDCADEALENLDLLKPLLNAEKQKGLDVYINQLKELRAAIAKDWYGNDISTNRYRAERIRMNILRNFTYSKIKDQLA